jgi:hypothetical protein
LLLMNKAEDLDAAARARIAAQLPARPLCWTSQAALPLAQLPGFVVQAEDDQGLDTLPNPAAPLVQLWHSPQAPICQVQAQAEGWSIGWRWHPSQRFERMRVQRWLAALPWRRAKLVLHSEAGWCSANALDGQPLEWQSSEWRKDSRLELIFDRPQDEARLKAEMAACRLQ